MFNKKFGIRGLVSPFLAALCSSKNVCFTSAVADALFPESLAFNSMLGRQAPQKSASSWVKILKQSSLELIGAHEAWGYAFNCVHPLSESTSFQLRISSHTKLWDPVLDLAIGHRWLILDGKGFLGVQVCKNLSFGSGLFCDGMCESTGELLVRHFRFSYVCDGTLLPIYAPKRIQLEISPQFLSDHLPAYLGKRVIELDCQGFDFWNRPRGDEDRWESRKLLLSVNFGSAFGFPGWCGL